jgi:ubiquinone biosynthesis protein
LENFSQYKDLAHFIWKYANSDLIERAKLRELTGDGLDEQDETSGETSPDQMVEDLKNLGPAFIKLGQLLSTRPDLLPPEYIAALVNLQDDVDAAPFEKIREIVENELGVKISKAFQEFKEEPIATASLGQVHFAKLRDGRPVVVKVQRPGIQEEVHKELEVLDKTSTFLEKHTDAGKRFRVHMLFQHFRKTILRELDYLKEAENIRQFKENLKEFKRIVVPEPVSDFTTVRVLTMQFLDGQKITEITPLKKLELDGDVIADELFRAYLQQIVIDGLVHVDPHPGNLHLMESGKVALLDFGMVAHISPAIRNQYLKLMINIGEGNADEVVDDLIEMSEHMDETDEENFRSSIGTLILENLNRSAAELQTGKIILEIVRYAGTSGFQLPIEMSLIGKTLLNLDQVSRTLSPDFSPNEAIKKHAMELTNKHMFQDLTSMNYFQTLLDSKELVEKFPDRLNKIMDNVARNEMKLKVDAFDEGEMMKGFQKVANRISIGLILAALIVGSSLLMQVDTEFQLFGYPGLAMVFFLLALLGAAMLAFQIFMADDE